jgi:MFS family permease
VAFFITIVDLTIVNGALLTIGVKLHFPESDLLWVVTAYGLTFGGFLLLGGRAPAVEAGSARLWSISPSALPRNIATTCCAPPQRRASPTPPRSR